MWFELKQNDNQLQETNTIIILKSRCSLNYSCNDELIMVPSKYD